MIIGPLGGFIIGALTVLWLTLDYLGRQQNDKKEEMK